MHRSRLAGFIIDCRTADLDAAAEFWGAALGFPLHRPKSQDEAGYIHLKTAPEDLHIEVQKVGHASRVHLDIETDDIEAEVARLEQLGATEVSRPHDGRWVVMQAPTGQRFCVVRIRDAKKGAALNSWA